MTTAVLRGGRATIGGKFHRNDRAFPPFYTPQQLPHHPSTVDRATLDRDTSKRSLLLDLSTLELDSLFPPSSRSLLPSLLNLPNTKYCPADGIVSSRIERITSCAYKILLHGRVGNGRALGKLGWLRIWLYLSPAQFSPFVARLLSQQVAIESLQCNI